MPILFWLALLLGYLTGVAAAVLLLPAPLIEPLHGPLVLTTVVVLAAFGVLLQLRRARGRALRSTPPRQGAAAQDERAGRDGDPDDRWPLMVRLEPPDVIGPNELRQILYEGRVAARLRPIADPAAPQAAWYLALPRLHATDDRQLEPGRYRTTAARCELLGLIDRLLLLRCAEMLRASRADGRETLMLCGIAAASLTDPAFLGEIEQQLSDDPQLGQGLVLALEHVVRDGPAVAKRDRLRQRGLRFCLRRVGPPPSDAAELGKRGFDFVLLEARRFALGSEGVPSGPALPALQRVFGAIGPTLLVGRSGFDQATLELPGDWARAAADGAFELARPSAA